MRKIITFFEGVDRFVAEAPISLVVLLAFLFGFAMIGFFVLLTRMVAS